MTRQKNNRENYVNIRGTIGQIEWFSMMLGVCLVFNFSIRNVIGNFNNQSNASSPKKYKTYLFMNMFFFRYRSNQSIEIKSQKFLELIFNHSERSFWLNYDYLKKANEKCLSAPDIQYRLL